MVVFSSSRYPRLAQVLSPAKAVVAVLLKLSAIILCVRPAYAEDPVIPGEVVVEMAAPYLAPIAPRQAKVLASRSILGATVQESLSSDGANLRMRVPQSLAAIVGSISAEDSAKESCANLKRRNPGLIKACSPNYLVHTSSVTPNDSMFQELWGLRGQNGIDATRAWSITTGGDDIVVAVVDTGIDYNHPDLRENVWVNPREIPGNSLDDDGNGYIDDIHGINAATNSGDPMDDNNHGTHVSGTIAASGNNGIGVAGVNWRAKVVAAKFLSANGSGSLADAIKAINYIVDLKNQGINIKVMNNSWGGGGYSQNLYNAIARANEAGILFVAAAGNSGQDNDSNPSYPAGYELPNVVSVAAIDSQGNLASFSNYGANTVDIAAPGVGIVSTAHTSPYARFSGTSMAAPHVAGALGMILGAEPGLTSAQAIERIYSSGTALTTLYGAVRTGRTLNLGRAVSGESTPVTGPDGDKLCRYSVEETGFSPDLSADSAPIVISSDDNNYSSINLPFEVTWDGGPVSTITVSPNGVVYMGQAPYGNDYLNGSTARRNSIAALHADLYPVGDGYGVRAKVSEDSVTISWVASAYALKSGYAIVRLKIHATGEIDSWYQFSDGDIEEFFQAASTVGVHGSNAESITTYSYEDGRVRSGLGIRFTPSCGTNSVAKPAQLHFAGISGGKTSSVLTPGRGFAVSAFGTGSGPVQLRFVIDSQVCNELATRNFTDGKMQLKGKVPSALRGVRRVSVSIAGTSLTKRAAVVRSSANSGRVVRRMSSRARSATCNALSSSLR
jgi:subtilisin family serine protease